MKCAMCGRSIVKAALTAGDYVFGPKCARKLKGAKPRKRKAVDVVVDRWTLPLFPEKAEQVAA